MRSGWTRGLALGLTTAAAVAGGGVVVAGCGRSTTGDPTPPPPPQVGRAVVDLALEAPGSGGLYAVTGALRRLPPAGQAWETVAPPGPALVLGVEADAAGALYAWGRRGAEGFSLRSDDGGASWGRLDRGGLPTTPTPRFDLEQALLEPDPGVPERVWAGYARAPAADFDALFVSDDRGATWRAAGAGFGPEEDALELAFDAADPDLRYVRTEARVLVTRDGGRAWAALDEQGLPAPPRALVADPRLGGRVYALLDAAAFRSDGGGSWVEVVGVAAVLDQLDRAATALAVDPGDPDRLWLAAGPELVGSDDGGRTWASRSTNLRLDLVRLLAVDPAAPGRLLAAGEGGVAESRDGGLSWSRLPVAGLFAP